MNKRFYITAGLLVSSFCGVFLIVTPISAATCSSVAQYGITWTFDQSYECGQFVNGDWWVVGPVTINTVSPAWDGIGHGTMINPAQTTSQGYDTRAYGFNDTLRVKFPVAITPGSSVVSVQSLTSCATGGAHECLADAAVLTVVDSPMPAGTFRPAYFGSTKVVFNVSQVRYDLLPNLPVPNKPLPNLDSVMTRVWLDHGPRVNGAVIHPLNNMPPYPRDSSMQVSQLAVMALVDSPKKTTYVHKLIQLGIDLYPISLVNNDAWGPPGGGFGSGRKWPIIFTGLMLDNDAMKNPLERLTSKPGVYKFAEDGFTYYGASTAQYPDGKPLWGEDCLQLGYTYPFFGNHTCRDPYGVWEAENDPYGNGGSYRSCCTSHIWSGQALAAQIMGAEALWGYDIFFDYMNRWTNEPETWANSSLDYYKDVYGYSGNGGGFMMAMWETYWDQYYQPGSPTPPPTPAPTVTLGVNPTAIIAGGLATLSWTSSNTTSCSGTNFTPTGWAGSSTVTPAQTTVYAITCTGTGGFTSATTTLTVSTPPPPTPNKFIIGDQVKTTDRVNVRQTPSLSGKPGKQNKRALGIVIQGPSTGGGYTWWKIDFNAGVDGWVAENYLIKTSLVTAVASPQSSADLRQRLLELLTQLKMFQTMLLATPQAIIDN